MRAVTLCFIVIYPLSMHFSVAIGDPSPCLLLLLLAVLMISIGLFRSYRYKAAAYTLFGAMGVYFFSYYLFPQQITVLYLPPLVVSVFLLWLFGRSLVPGRLALISQVAEAYHGELPPPLARYTRRLTLVWTVYFALLAASVLYLGFIDSDSHWSSYLSVANYLIIGGLLGGEYVLRICRFKDIQHPSFIGFIRLLNNSRVYLPFYNR
jgi:uncharacterized membrane protein